MKSINNEQISLELENIVQAIVKELQPEKIYLFGSYARGDENADSDFDIYVILEDTRPASLDMCSRAYKAIWGKADHPVDILVQNRHVFNRRKRIDTVEKEVEREGLILYDAVERMAEIR